MLIHSISFCIVIFYSRNYLSGQNLGLRGYLSEIKVEISIQTDLAMHFTFMST